MLAEHSKSVIHSYEYDIKISWSNMYLDTHLTMTNNQYTIKSIAIEHTYLLITGVMTCNTNYLYGFCISIARKALIFGKQNDHKLLTIQLWEGWGDPGDETTQGRVHHNKAQIK